MTSNIVNIGWFYETMTSNILNNEGKTEVYRRDRSMVSSQAGTNLCLFVLVLQGMTSNISKIREKKKFIGPQAGQWSLSEHKTPSIQSSLHSSRQPCHGDK